MRARALIDKVGAGVGAAQMQSAAAAVLSTAAVQSGHPQLGADATLIANADAPSVRASLLIAAFDARLSGREFSLSMHNLSALPSGEPVTPLAAHSTSSAGLSAAATIGIACGAAMAALIIALGAYAMLSAHSRSHHRGRLVPEARRHLPPIKPTVETTSTTTGTASHQKGSLPRANV